MGRPLKKDIYGTNVLGLPGLSTNTLAGIAVQGYFGGAYSASYIIRKQRGAKTYVVAKIESFTCNTITGSRSITNMSDQVEVTVGDELSGPGIPSGARITSIDSATTATISIAATATATGITVTHWGAQVVGKLVSSQPSANGEIRIMGSTTGQTPGNTAIAKLTKRIARGFSGTRYKWYLDNDSTADVLVLIAV